MTIDLKEFDELINLGRVKKEVKVGSFKIVLSTLNSGQYSKAVGRVPDDIPQSKRFENVQREVIAAAIETINGKEMSHEDKSQLLTVGQLGLSNLLYTEYLGLFAEQEALIEDSKKNSSEDQMLSKDSPKAVASK